MLLRENDLFEMMTSKPKNCIKQSLFQ